MDIIDFIVTNESSILLIIAVIMGIISQYYSKQANLLYAAGQAIVTLEQAFLGAIADGVITQAEMTTILADIEAAKKAVADVITVFTQPQTFSQKLSILLGTSGVNDIIKQLNQKTQMLQRKAAMNTSKIPTKFPTRA